MDPQTAVGIERGRPYSIPAEKVIAIHLTDIARVILMPFQVHLADSVDRMVIVLMIFAEIDGEMAMMPVCI